MIAFVNWDNSIRLWNLYEQKEHSIFEGHNEEISSLCFSPKNNQLASGSVDKSIRLWSMDEAKENVMLEGHKGTVLTVCFNNDGQLLASG